MPACPNGTKSDGAGTVPTVSPATSNGAAVAEIMLPVRAKLAPILIATGAVLPGPTPPSKLFCGTLSVVCTPANICARVAANV
ncbi:MAG TPA: hypothetical protein PLO16_05325 [Acidocella sp.]|nr:hypothetical protein [Acidocella sp.]